jgi:hypothetical protein
MLEGLSITLTQWKNKGNISLHIAFIVSKENMTITSVGVDYRVTEVKTTGTDEYLVEETADEIDSMIDSVRSDAIDKMQTTLCK